LSKGLTAGCDSATAAAAQRIYRPAGALFVASRSIVICTRHDCRRGFDHPAVLQAPVAAIDRRGRQRAHPEILPLFQRRGRTLDVERDFLRHAVHREIARQLELAGAVRDGALGLERGRRELGDVEEVRGLQVLVARY
jgi:hypothetical protein